MAKANVEKFFEKLASDKAWAEKFSAADKAYAEKHMGESVDDAANRAALEEIVLPLAKEAGLPFTADEMMSVEQEKLAQMQGEICDEEMAQATGGASSIGIGAVACVYIGVGVGGGCAAEGRKAGLPDNMCVVLGSSFTVVANACWFKGAGVRALVPD